MTPHFAARTLLLGATGTGFAMYDLPDGIKKHLPANLDYPTPPSEEIAKRVEGLLGSALARSDGRPGFDHTTWMPLRAMFPAADVPVLELGYPYVPEAEAFALGKKLAPLRDEGFLFLASGGMTHNLAAEAVAPPAWSRDFDAWATAAVAKSDADALVAWRAKAPASDLAHPDDGGHFRVLLVALGVALHARTAPSTTTFPVTGFEGALSKRCVEFSA